MPHFSAMRIKKKEEKLLMATTKQHQDETPVAETDTSLSESYPFLADYDAETIVGFVDENITSMGALDELKVTPQGVWEIPQLFSDKPVRKDAIRGIIVAAKTGRALWPPFVKGQKAAPICYSDDMNIGWGPYGIDPETNEPGELSTTFGRCYISRDRMCPMAKFTETVENGKRVVKAPACSTKTLLFVVLEGDSVPTRIMLSPKSLSPWGAYSKKINRVGKTGTYGVVTELTMNPEGSFSTVQFREVALLSKEEQAVAKAYGDAILAAFPPRNAELVATIPSLQASRAAVAALPSGDTTDVIEGDNGDF